MNKVIQIGRLVADPELGYPNGKPQTTENAFCRMRIAVDRPYTSKENKVSDFFDVVAFRGSAEYASNYLSKGQLVSVEGSLRSRSVPDQDGKKRDRVSITVDRIESLSAPKSGGGEAVKPAEAAPAVEAKATVETEDFDPFADE